jgi:hypothetical protein
MIFFTGRRPNENHCVRFWKALSFSWALAPEARDFSAAGKLPGWLSHPA